MVKALTVHNGIHKPLQFPNGFGFSSCVDFTFLNYQFIAFCCLKILKPIHCAIALQHFFCHWIQNKREKNVLHLIPCIVNFNFMAFIAKAIRSTSDSFKSRFKFFGNDLLFCWQIYCHGNAVSKQIYLIFPLVFSVSIF